jgi:hypothetical protein
MRRIIKTSPFVVALVCAGLSPASSAAPQLPTDTAKPPFLTIKVYDDNRFGFSLDGAWYWLNSSTHLIAIDVGGVAYNMKDVQSFERRTKLLGGDVLSVQLRSGEQLETQIGNANWIACRQVEVNKAPCAKGGRVANIISPDPMNDFDGAFASIRDTDLAKMNFFENPVRTNQASWPPFSRSKGKTKVFINEEFQSEQNRVDAYLALRTAEKKKYLEKEVAALAALRSSDRAVRYRTELQTEFEYWQKEPVGTRMFCETRYGVGANISNVVISIGDGDKVQCRGHDAKEVRVGLLSQAGWKVMEQSSRPFSDATGSSEFLVYAQVVMQKVK